MGSRSASLQEKRRRASRTKHFALSLELAGANTSEEFANRVNSVIAVNQRPRKAKSFCSFPTFVTGWLIRQRECVEYDSGCTRTATGRDIIAAATDQTFEENIASDSSLAKLFQAIRLKTENSASDSDRYQQRRKISLAKKSPQTSAS